MHSVNTTIAEEKKFLSLYKDAALVKQLRRGCDGTPGLVGVNDACGVCQGDNRTCTDCHGVVNGNATLGKQIRLGALFVDFLDQSYC